MTYQILGQDEQDDMIVGTMLSAETDMHAHTVNLERFTAMATALAGTPLETKYKKLRDDTASRIVEVTAIINATTPQLPPTARIDAAKLRIKPKV